MIKILFICHGNICRSPMAEFVMKDMVRERELEDLFEIASAATSMEEIGNPVYPPARRKLKEHGISCDGHHARRVERRDYDAYDYLIVMENYNVRNLLRVIGSDPQGKVSRLLDHTDHPGDIDDPWYTGDFTTVYRQIREGCEALLEECLREKRQEKRRQQ